MREIVNTRVAIYLDGHLVNVDTLLNAELGDEDVKGSIKNIDDTSLADDRSVTLSKVGDEQAQEEMCRLLLGKLGGITFTREDHQPLNQTNPKSQDTYTLQF